MQDPGRFLRIDAVSERTGLGRSEIYRRVQTGRFPQPLKLAERLSVWVESEIIAWQVERLNER